MKRASAIPVGIGLMIIITAGVFLVAWLLASGRIDDRHSYAHALTQQRRAAGQPLAVHSAPDRTTAPDQMLCVGGVQTFAAVLATEHFPELVDDHALDVAQLRALSDGASRAERYAEQAAAGPALPQRLGRTRTQAADKTASWKTLEPPVIECGGSPAYAAFPSTPPSLDAVEARESPAAPGR